LEKKEPVLRKKPRGLGTEQERREEGLNLKRKKKEKEKPRFLFLHFLSLEKKEPVLRKKKNIYFYAGSSTLKVRGKGWRE